MRVIYIHQYFNTPDMPGITRSYEMARRLVAAGHSVDMITTDRTSNRQPGTWHVTEEAGIRVHWTPVAYDNPMAYRERIRAFLRFAWRAGHRAAQLPADCVFATSTPLTVAIPAVYAARWQRIPMVFEVRDLWPKVPIALGALRNPVARRVALSLEHAAYRNAAHIIALSPDIKAGIAAAGYPEDRITVVPNSADLDLFAVDASVGESLRQRHSWLQDRPLILYAGTIGLVNGLSYFVRVAASCSHIDPELRFVIVGSGREEAEVRSLAEALNVLNRNFFMINSVPKSEVPAWLSACTVATSFTIDMKELWANSANKVFDTFAAGKPLAINYGGWQADLLLQTGAGLVLDPRAIECSAEQLAHAVRDGRWLARASAAASRLGREQFSRDALAAELERVLVNAVDRRAAV
jgi:glycosyltransferase involved in cell wall biosynthesis